jgi:hypothetical protein
MRIEITKQIIDPIRDDNSVETAEFKSFTEDFIDRAEAAYAQALIVAEKSNPYHDPKTGRFTSKAGVSLSYRGPDSVSHGTSGMPSGYKTYHPHKKDVTQTLSPDDVMRRHFKDPAKYNDLHKVADSFVNAYHAQAAREFASRGYI